jgi:phosphatidylglycerol lysyltransferase
MVSMLPGGIGVFDGALFLLLHTQGTDSDALVAGIVMFRIVYYVVPWLIGIYLGGTVLTSGENAPLGPLLRHWRVSPLLATLRLPLVLFSAIAVRALAYLTFAAGVVLLLSSAVPGPLDEELAVWHLSLPQAMLEGLHLGSVFVGVMLIILAGGIVRQVERVYRMVVPVLLCGALLMLLKDFHYVEAGFLVATAVLLRMQRARFYRKSFPMVSLRTARWMLAMLLSLGLYAVIGHLLYDNVWQAHLPYASVSATAQAQRFLHSLLWLPLFALGIQGWLFFRLPRPDYKRPDSAALAAASKFLNQYGGGAFAHLILAGDKQLLYAADNRVLIPYAHSRHCLVALGDPNGDSMRFREAIEAFYSLADQYDLEPVFYEVSQAYLGLYHDLGFKLFKLGERALVPTAAFTLAGKSRESLRHSVKQAERAGVCFEVLAHPLSEALWRELQAVSAAWLDRRHTAEKGFSLGRFDREYLQRSPLALVRQGQRVVAFASLMPDYGAHRQLAIDLMRSLPTAPKGAMDFLFVRLIEYARDNGYRYFDLGTAPLSGVGQSRYARASEKVARLAFEHGDRFYSYKGLRSFKAKFSPEWHGVYLAHRPRSALPGLLLDIAALIAGGYRRLLGNQ